MPLRPIRPDPAPEPPPPVVIRSVRFTLTDVPADVIPLGTLRCDHPDTEPFEGHWVPESGLMIYDLPEAWPAPYGADADIECDGYEPFHKRFVLADFSLIPPSQPSPELRTQTTDFEDNTLLTFALQPLIELTALHPDGEGFTDANGHRWTQVGCSDFRLLERFLAGEDIAPVLHERASIGFNQLRVFLMCGNMFQLRPDEHPDYHARLKAFCERVAQQGLRLELTVLVDATVVMPHLVDQQAFFHAVCDTVRGLPHVQVELVNEVEQTINTIDPSQFHKPDGILSSHGSKGVVDAAKECVCVEPIWDYGTLHPARNPDWPRLGHNIYEDLWVKYRKCGFINESCRPDQGRGPVPSDHYDAAVNMGIMGGGGTFHSQSGKDSRLFSSDERACAEAWVRGARNVDLSLRGGEYVAGHLTSPRFPLVWKDGDSARAHGRIIGDRAVCSLPQMREGYVPQGQDGWSIAWQDGSYVECVR